MKEVKKQKHTQKVVYENTRLPARIGRSIHSICRRSLKFAYSRKRQSNAYVTIFIFIMSILLGMYTRETVNGSIQ